MKQKKTLQILLLVFAGLIVLYTGVNLYQKQQSSKGDLCLIRIFFGRLLFLV